MPRYVNLRSRMRAVGQTDTGKVREHNEDAIAWDTDIGLFVLADGMGGYNAGEVASGMATTVIVSEMRQALKDRLPLAAGAGSRASAAQALLHAQIDKANTSIYQAAQSQPQYAGMGTTLVVAVFRGTRVLVGRAEIGAAWSKRSNEGRDYLGLKLDDPSSVDGLLDAMARDKKAHHDFTFVLDGVNGPEVVSGVPREVIYEQLLAAGGVK